MNRLFRQNYRSIKISALLIAFILMLLPFIRYLDSTTGGDWYVEEMGYVFPNDMIISSDGTIHIIDSIINFGHTNECDLVYGQWIDEVQTYEIVDRTWDNFINLRIGLCQNDMVHIFYEDTDTMSLMHAWNNSGTWERETVIMNVSLNYPCSFSVKENGDIHLILRSVEDELGIYFALKEDQNWTIIKLNDRGYICDLAPGQDGSSHFIYSYPDFENSTTVLMYGHYSNVDLNLSLITIADWESQYGFDHYALMRIFVDLMGKVNFAAMGSKYTPHYSKIVLGTLIEGNWILENITGWDHHKSFPEPFLDNDGNPFFMILNYTDSDTYSGYLKIIRKEADEWTATYPAPYLMRSFEGDIDQDGNIHIFYLEANYNRRYLRLGDKTMPDPPIKIDFHRGDGNVTITWEPPVNDGGDIVFEYDIYRKEQGSNYERICTMEFDEGPCWFLDENVTVGTNYTYQISSRNVLGSSKHSDPVEIEIITVPSPPLDVKAISGLDWINITWEPSSYSARSDDITYLIRAEWNDPVDYKNYWPPSGQFFYNFSAETGATYSLTMKVRGSLGWSEETPEINITVGDVPWPPELKDLVHGLDFISFWVAFWDESYKDAHCGFSVERFNIYRESDGVIKNYSLPRIYPPPSGYNRYFFNDTEIEMGVNHTYWACAVNLKGESPPSNKFTVRLGEVPDPVTNVKLIRGNGTLNISWEPPLFNGGPEVTAYRIIRERSGVEIANFSVRGDQIFFNDTDLELGLMYEYRISAVNIIGESNLSDVVSGKPLAKPSPPSNFIVAYIDGGIELKWDRPGFSGGSNIDLSYRIMKKVNDSEWSEIGSQNNTSLIDTSLEVGSTYHYRIVVSNGLWESDPTPSRQVKISGPVDVVPPSGNTSTSEVFIFSTIALFGVGFFIVIIIFVVTIVVILIMARKRKRIPTAEPRENEVGWKVEVIEIAEVKVDVENSTVPNPQLSSAPEETEPHVPDRRTPPPPPPTRPF